MNFEAVEEKRIIMEACYDGTDFVGWQNQPEGKTIQGTIEDALSKLNSNRSIQIVGCGRTDAGVHAKQYFFHLDGAFDDLNSLVYKLNKMLPSSIAIAKAKFCEKHARFDAIKRTYRYFISNEKTPFQDRFCWVYQRELNIEQMNNACSYLIGTKDFASFAKGDNDAKTTLCNVFHAVWQKTEDGYVFEVSANRFLRNMVRAIVGTLIEVGIGNLMPEDIEQILQKKSRQEAALSVPAKGLFLWEVNY